MPDTEKKIRIQLFDPEFNQLSDKLTAQKTTFYKGPDETHLGPLKIEVCLFCKEDVDEFKVYLDKLRGIIPLETEKERRGRKKKIKDVTTLREQLVERLLEAESMKEWTALLRENQFQFTSLDLLQDLGYPIQISAVARKKQKFMVRMVKKAKNPINDKYDPSLIIGFKDKEVFAYSGEETLASKELDKGLGNTVKIPAKAKVKFPVYLTQDERNKFRAQMQLLRDDPDRKATAFYRRWVHEVAKASPAEIEFPRIDEIPSPYDNR